MEAQSTQGEEQKSARLTLHPIMLSEAISTETGKEALHCITLHCQHRVAFQRRWNCPFLLLSVYFLPISGLLIWIQMELDSVLDASVTTCVNWKFYLISKLEFIPLWNRETSFLVTSTLPPNCCKKSYTKCLVQSLINSKRLDQATRIIIQLSIFLLPLLPPSPAHSFHTPRSAPSSKRTKMIPAFTCHSSIC